MTTISVDMLETTYLVAASGSNVRMNGTGADLIRVTAVWPIGTAASTYNSSAKTAIVYVDHTEFSQLCGWLSSGTVECTIDYDNAQTGTVKTVTNHEFLPSQALLRQHAMERRVATIEASVQRVEQMLAGMKALSGGGYANGPPANA
jgi:hypothetical protein